MSWRLYHNFQGLLLAAWGLFLLERISSGKILFYINSRYVFLIVMAAFMFFLLAQAVLTAKRDEHTNNSEPPAMRRNSHREDADDHRHQPSGWALIVLALPLLLGVMMPAKELDTGALKRRSLNTMAPVGSLSHMQMTSVSLPSEERSLLDWVAVFNSTSDFSSYHGMAVDVSGFVYHQPRLAENQFLVSRFVITCCVADASPLGMLVGWQDAGQLPDDEWVRVKGSIQTFSIDGEKVPGIAAESIEIIEAPDQPYLYP